jgi:hypothetical protein
LLFQHVSPQTPLTERVETNTKSQKL